jgi:AcrR family transcriptional regulator
MRYAPTHKEEARSRLVEVTGALAKQKGFAATGVDGLMAAAGMTSGAFYSHFRSKGELLEAIVAHELQRSTQLFQAASRAQLLEVVRGYLSEAHVAHPESGCAVPVLAPEIARAGLATQQAFAQGVQGFHGQLQALLGDETAAWSLMAQLVGAVATARALPPGPARQALLAGVLHQVEQLLKSDAAPREDL